MGSAICYGGGQRVAQSPVRTNPSCIHETNVVLSVMEQKALAGVGAKLCICQHVVFSSDTLVRVG
eukprot:m.519990 g.519990  ORF g.519990 m.519990 type:complete len:65 (+) comp21950_c0_seq8:282-476(+)